MTVENPTPSNEGASIEARLEKFLSAEEPQQEPKEAKQPEAEAKIPDPAEPTEQPEKAGDPEGDKQPQLTTAELAKIFGADESAFDVDEDGTVVVKTKIDGKDGAAKFADVLKNYQLGVHAENRTRAVAEQEKALQTRMQEADKEVKARVDHAEQLANVAGNELMREYQSIDWNSLRQVNPGQYAALQQDFQNRKAQVQQVFQNVNLHRAQEAKKYEGQKVQYLTQEAEKLPTLIPEWKDAAVRDKEGKELVEWGLKKGFTQEQMKGLNESSALHVAIVRNAMLFDKLQASKVEVENKVRLAPKIVKPGTPQLTTKDGNLRNLKQAVKSTGGKNGSVEAWLIAKGLA